jgi:hypothetical protein
MTAHVRRVKPLSLALFLFPLKIYKKSFVVMARGYVLASFGEEGT